LETNQPILVGEDLYRTMLNMSNDEVIMMLILIKEKRQKPQIDEYIIDEKTEIDYLNLKKYNIMQPEKCGDFYIYHKIMSVNERILLRKAFKESFDSFGEPSVIVPGLDNLELFRIHQEWSNLLFENKGKYTEEYAEATIKMIEKGLLIYDNF